jgi:hypothetical protein
MSDAIVVLDLTRAEALVLFDWLSRPSSGDRAASLGEAEQTVLWRIEAELESTLVEPLAPDYERLVDEARREVLQN